MTAPAGAPDGEGGLSPIDRIRASEAREIAEDNPGWAVTCDLWGQYRAQRGDDIIGPVCDPMALRSMIGLPKPRRPAS